MDVDNREVGESRQERRAKRQERKGKKRGEKEIRAQKRLREENVDEDEENGSGKTNETNPKKQNSVVEEVRHFEEMHLEEMTSAAAAAAAAEKEIVTADLEEMTVEKEIVTVVVEKKNGNGEKRPKRRLPEFKAVAPVPPLHPRRFYGHFSNDDDLAQALLEFDKAHQQFELDMEKFRQSRMQWAQLAVAHEKNVPYEKRSAASLERELLARGLDFSGVRTVLEERLRRHDANSSDRSVTTLQMKIVERKMDVVLSVDPQKQMIIGSGEQGFLGLPHDVIRKHILVHFDIFTEYPSLLALRRTCGNTFMPMW